MSISDPQQSVASEIYSADGKIIGKYFKENRTPVEYGDISPILIKTLIYTEDERFYQHFGTSTCIICKNIKFNIVFV